MPLQLSVGTVNGTRWVEIEVCTVWNDFTLNFDWLDCTRTASPHIGWAFFAPVVQPSGWTEARGKLKCRVFEAWVRLVGREQFVIGTIASFPGFLLLEKGRNTALA